MARAIKYTVSLCGSFMHERDPVGAAGKPVGRVQGLTHYTASSLRNYMWIRWGLCCGDGSRASPAASAIRTSSHSPASATVAPLLLKLLSLPSSVHLCESSVSGLQVPRTGSTPQGTGTSASAIPHILPGALGESMSSLTLWQARPAVYQ